MVRFIGKGFKAHGPNRNVVNLLRLLAENHEIELYISASDYELGSRDVKVDENVHHGYKHQLSRIRIIDICSSQERFNFSLSCLKDVSVLNTDTNEYEPKKVFRSYNVIRDGKLVVDKLYAKLPKRVFNLLESARVLIDQVGNRNNLNYGVDYIYEIDLSNLPLISLNWAQPDRIGLYRLMHVEIMCMEAIRYAKAKLKDYAMSGQILPQNDNDIYIEEYTHLKKNIRETYDVDCIVYRIPEFNKMYGTLNETAKLSIDKQCRNIVETHNYIRKWNKNLNYIRLRMRCIIYAIENSKKKGSYEWTELQKLPRSKDKMFQETIISYMGKDVTMQRLEYIKRV